MMGLYITVCHGVVQVVYIDVEARLNVFYIKIVIFVPLGVVCLDPLIILDTKRVVSVVNPDTTRGVDLGRRRGGRHRGDHARRIVHRGVAHGRREPAVRALHKVIERRLMPLHHAVPVGAERDQGVGRGRGVGHG